MSDEEKPTGPSSEVPLPAQSDVSVAPEPSPSEACSILLVQAKQAFQEQRRKDCLIITRVILAVDPDNKEAQVIENWIRSDLQKEIEVVRAKILKAHHETDGETAQRGERMLRAILLVDPQNKQANLLLQEVRAAASNIKSPAPAKEPVPAVSDTTEQSISNEEYPGYDPSPPNWRRLYTALIIVLVVPIGGFALWKYNTRPAVPAAAGSTLDKAASTGVLEIAFNSNVKVYLDDEYQGTTPLKPFQLAPRVYHLKYEKDGKEIGREDVTIRAGNTTRNTIQQPSGKLVFFVVPAKGVQLKMDGIPFGLTPESADVTPGFHTLEFSAVGFAPATVNVGVAVGKRSTIPVLLKPLTAEVGVKPDNLPKPPPVAPPPNSVGVSLGTLRLDSPVESPIDIDVYEKDKRLGSTPLSVDLPAGPHTLEFRHEGLKKTANLTIQAGASTTVTVKFEITVQIQVKPYAEVFLFGDPIVPLGETPLNKISVPVGGTLVFRHPKYPEKRYRVTPKDSDTGISLSFP